MHLLKCLLHLYFIAATFALRGFNINTLLENFGSNDGNNGSGGDRQSSSQATDDTKYLNQSEPVLVSSRDIEILTAFVLIRGHIVIGPESSMDVDQSKLDKLLYYLYKYQNIKHTSSVRIMYPATEERDLGCESLPSDVRPICNAVRQKCLSAREMLNMIPRTHNTYHQALTRLCPFMLIRRSLCKREHPSDNNDKKIKLVEPSSEKVWAFAVLFVTLSIVVSMGGLILLPFLNRESRRTILTLFEGLAVGGLAGSAILHLLPQAFDIGDENYRKYFVKTFLVFFGIYIFYVIERLLKIFNSLKPRGRKKPRSSSFRNDDEHFHLYRVPNTVSAATVTPSNTGSNIGNTLRRYESPTDTLLLEREETKCSHLNSAKNQIDRFLKSMRLTHQPSVDQRTSQLNEQQAAIKTDDETLSISRNKQSYVVDVAGRRKDQYTSTRNFIDSVAWMIVLGDASLNFIDGLSIGAAFDRNILAGISISIAIMLEEVPHRLGTFAVLMRAGMDMNQSFLYIFLSACSLYPGLVLGIFLGDAADDASPYIFAMAAGMFLYMSLVDVMKEMNRSMENAIRKGLSSSLQILALQNLGIIISVICLSVLALYEKDMDFEAVEIKEITENALQ